LTRVFSRSTLSTVSKKEKVIVLLLRLSLGWIFLYSGFIKVTSPSWSAEGLLKSAHTLQPLYQWFLTPSILPTINFINEWGQLLLGVSLILGIGVRLSSILGVILLSLYYLAQLNFPYVNKTSYLIDEHVIYSLVLLYFAFTRAGRIYGIENWCANLPICRKIPRIRSWFG